MELISLLMLAIALAASCGFRVFLPVFLVALGARCGYIPVGQYSVWLGSDYALVVFALAAVLELVIFFVPCVDNIADWLFLPLSALMGVVVSAIALNSQPELIQWGGSVIIGVGFAGMVHLGMASLRVASTTASGGMTNFVIAGVESIAAAILPLLAFFLPWLAGVAGILALLLVMRGAWLIIPSRGRKKPAPLITDVE